MPKVMKLANIQGLGVQCELLVTNGTSNLERTLKVAIGSKSFIASKANPNIIQSENQSTFLSRNRNPIESFVSIDGVLAASTTLGDEIRPEAKMMVEHLKAYGYNADIVST